MTIATPTIVTWRRYGRNVATTRRTVVREIGRLSSSDSGAAQYAVTTHAFQDTGER